MPKREKAIILQYKKNFFTQRKEKIRKNPLFFDFFQNSTCIFHFWSYFIFVVSTNMTQETKKQNLNKERNKKMAKFVCGVCGYIHEGPEAPANCPQCKAPAAKFVKQESAESKWAIEHKIATIDGIAPEVVEGLRANFNGECCEVGMYLAMSRQAERQGYPEIAEAYKRSAFEEAEHAAKFAELLGEVVSASTKTNLEMRVAAEHGACEGKMKLASRAKELGLDAIHDTVHEMAKDEARHGCGFKGLLERYFK